MLYVPEVLEIDDEVEVVVTAAAAVVETVVATGVVGHAEVVNTIEAGTALDN